MLKIRFSTFLTIESLLLGMNLSDLILSYTKCRKKGVAADDLIQHIAQLMANRQKAVRQPESGENTSTGKRGEYDRLTD